MHNRILLFFVLMAFSGALLAQELKVVKPITIAPELKHNVSMWQSDFNGDICALVLLKLDLESVEFEGDIVKKEYHNGTWHIWMPNGARWITILSKKYTPLRIDFAAVKGATVYTIEVKVLNGLIVVEPVHEDIMSTDAVKFKRIDPSTLKPCALLRIGIVSDSIRFHGSIIDKSMKSGEWWLWLSPGATALTIDINGYAPLELAFDSLQASSTYLATIKLPTIIIKNNPYKGSWFLTANYAYSLLPQHSFGFSVGRVGRFGWYVNFMTNGSFNFTSDIQLENNSESAFFLWSGEKKTTRLSAMAGGLVALGRWGYLYAGAGYGIRNSIWKTQNGTAVLMNTYSYNGFAIEGGLVFRFSDHMLMSLGYDCLEFGKYSELKIGAGYKF